MLGVVAGVLLGADSIHAQERLPIIDMHLHAHRLSDYGGGVRVCAGNEHMLLWGVDPRGGMTASILAGHKRCRSPIPRATSDSALMSQTLTSLRRYNIFAVTSGPIELVRAWRAAAPDRIIPAHAFGDPDSPTLEVFHQLIRSGEVALLAEVSPQYSGISLDDPVFDPYFALAEMLDVPVGVHLGEGPYGAPYRGFPKYRARLTTPFQLEDVLVKHPRLRIYVMHYASPLVDEMIALMYAHPQVYVDIAGNNWQYPRPHFHSQLKRLIDAGLGKRIMWGSDQMVWPGAIGVAIASVERASFLTDEQKRDIFYNNAARFLRLTETDMRRHRR